MKITRVEAIPLWASFADALGGADKVPVDLIRPAFGMRLTPLEGQGCVIVRVHTDEGLVGVGESMGRPGPRGHAAFVEDVLAPMLTEEDPLRVEAHWAAMSEELRFAPMALSGVDMALWDLRGRAYEEPVHRLLGGPLRTKVDCYASPVPYLPTPEGSAQRALKFVSEGFTAVKAKIGRSVETDLEHVAAIRDAVGLRVKVLVDANGAYSVPEAVRLARGLEREGVFWLEEPVQPEHPAQLAEVRRKVNLPIASGEWLGSVHQFRDLLDAGGADVLMPNVTRCGGITGFRRVAELAEIKNVAIAPHGVGSGVGVVAALHASSVAPNFLTYEYNQLFNPLRHAILSEPLVFRDGKLEVPVAPGLGVTLKEEILNRYRVDPHLDSRHEVLSDHDGSNKLESNKGRSSR